MDEPSPPAKLRLKSQADGFDRVNHPAQVPTPAQDVHALLQTNLEAEREGRAPLDETPHPVSHRRTRDFWLSFLGLNLFVGLTAFAFHHYGQQTPLLLLLAGAVSLNACLIYLFWVILDKY